MKKFSGCCTQFAAIVAAVISLSSGVVMAQDSDAARNEYNALRAACPAVVAINRGAVTCQQWVTLGGCLIGNATSATSSAVCTTSSAAASSATDHASVACGAQATEVTRLRNELATRCGRRPARDPNAPRRVSLPTCLGDEEFGGAQLFCTTRSGERLVGQRACRAANDRAQLRNAGCFCPPGRQPSPLFGRRNTAYCPVVIERRVINPPGVSNPSLPTDIDTYRGRLEALEREIRTLCAPLMPTEIVMTDDDGPQPTPTVTATDLPRCTQVRALIVELASRGDRTGGNVDLTAITADVEGLKRTVAQHTQQIGQHTTQINQNTAAIRELQRTRVRGNLGVFLAGEYGSGVASGQNPGFGILGVEGRLVLVPAFHIVLNGGLLLGESDVQQVGRVGGYAVGAGVGLQLRSGSVSFKLDLLFSVRTLAAMGGNVISPTGITETTMTGDFRGRIYAGQLNATLSLVSGLFFRAGLLVGTGEQVLGSDQAPGSFTPGGGETAVMGQLAIGYWLFGG